MAPVILELNTRWKCISHFISWGKSSSTCWVGGQVGLRASLDILQKGKSVAVTGFAPSTV